MDTIKQYIAGAGSFLAVVGLISTVLYFFKYNLKILMWVDAWGPTVGWIIRIGLIVGGGVLFFAGKQLQKPGE